MWPPGAEAARASTAAARARQSNSSMAQPQRSKAWQHMMGTLNSFHFGWILDLDICIFIIQTWILRGEYDWYQAELQGPKLVPKTGNEKGIVLPLVPKSKKTIEKVQYD